MAKSLALTFGYAGTDFTRIYTETVADSITAANVKTAVDAINASLKAGTADGLPDFFVADDFDGTNGKFNRILDATLENINSTVIYPAVQEGD